MDNKRAKLAMGKLVRYKLTKQGGGNPLSTGHGLGFDIYKNIMGSLPAAIQNNPKYARKYNTYTTLGQSLLDYVGKPNEINPGEFTPN